MQPRLKEIQAMLSRLIVAPEGVETALASEADLPRGGLDGLIAGDERLSAVDRVGIYANMYFYRLLDALKEDFPVTANAIGDSEFHNLITGYLVEYPPSDPSINQASRHLAEFARRPELAARWPFLSDLVRVERAIVEVFLGQDAQPLGADELRAVPHEEWALIPMRSHPSLQILECEWRIDETMRAFEAGNAPAPPRPESASILVWRTNCEVDYRALQAPERAAFEVLRDGAEFSLVCEAIAAHTGEADAPIAISGMLSRWLSDGLLVRA